MSGRGEGIKSFLSEKVKELNPSPTLMLDAKAKELISKGEDIISFGAGEPDFNSPESASQGAKKAIDEGKTKYTAVDGIPELKKSAVKRFYDFFGVKYSTSEVIVTPGAKMAIYEALFSLVNEGDEVIILSPYWVSYPEMVKMVGGVPKIVETTPENSFKPVPEEIEKAITERTKVIILNSPSNPTGAVIEPGILEEIAKIVKKKNVFVISDEIYATLVYDGEFRSFAHYLKDICIVIWGMSKTYSMTGWRIGFAFGPEEIISAMKKVQSQTTSNPTTPAQYAALSALEEESQRFVRETLEEFRRRRDLIYNLLLEIDGVSVIKPEGAFYIFPDVSKFLGKKFRTTDDISDFLLSEKKVLTIPGTGFGKDGFLRLSFALSEEKIKEGIRRIKEGLEEIKKIQT